MRITDTPINYPILEERDDGKHIPSQGWMQWLTALGGALEGDWNTLSIKAVFQVEAEGWVVETPYFLLLNVFNISQNTIFNYTKGYSCEPSVITTNLGQIVTTPNGFTLAPCTSASGILLKRKV